jgi:hypothetical protein
MRKWTKQWKTACCSSATNVRLCMLPHRGNRTQKAIFSELRYKWQKYLHAQNVQTWVTTKFYPEYPRNWQIIIKALSWQLPKSETCNKSRRSDIWTGYNTTKCMDLPFCMKHRFSTKSISPYYSTVNNRTSAPLCRANSCSTVRLSCSLRSATVGTQHCWPYSDKVETV